MKSPRFLNPDVPLHRGKPLPPDFRAFLLYVWRKNPFLWGLYFLQDILHFIRYPIAYIFLGRIIDLLKNAQPEAGLPQEIPLLLLMLLVAMLAGELAHIWTAHTLVHWKPKLRAAIRSDFLGYTMGHGHAYFQDNFSGALARKVSEVAESALRLHDIIRFQIFFAMVQMTTVMIFMTSVNLVYGMTLLAYILAVTLPIFLRLPRIRKRSLLFSEQRAQVTGTVVDILTNIPAIKSYASLPHEVAVHTEISAQEAKRSTKVIRTMVQIEDFRRLCLVLLGSGMTALCCLGWLKGWLTVGEVSTISAMSMMLAGTTWMLGGGIVQFVDEAGYITDALRITARPHDILDAANANTLTLRGGAVEYKDVTFSFPGHKVFENLNLSVSAGEKIALVGPSGAGKSTFVALLMRLYDLQDGDILIDGQKISGITQDSLRRSIAVIPQDTALFHRSLMDNIRYGRLDATDDEVIEASRRAHAHEFIAGLPQGYNTLVGERGIRLSGGQRQRIAIARAILKNAPILVLDEATSALDSESERLIQDALAELMQGKTVIAIAHRLSTIARMDRIIVFDRGRIAEEGKHAALVSRGGLYARLWAMQSGGFLHEEDPQGLPPDLRPDIA